ncbi:SET domain-containing protein-lysine N-methyltransferase [Candidatus Villigracilis affinis]|uniref:SET domain-containing protein-lysine N-methyltransferase n=1 Tax=Candidatus Villigracilis affinis TaxID=3140682 RepID=UPI001DB729BD|nr:SET domain-containing protein [Anaerolineales bacterium]
MTFSFLNRKCKAREHPEGGCGVFATDFISKGGVDLLVGRTYRPPLETGSRHAALHTARLQIDEDLYILTAENPEPNDCFNHSCDPNLGFSGQIGLVAIRDILNGEELCFDYAMSDGGPYDEFECYCGSPICRKKSDWQRLETARIVGEVCGIFLLILRSALSKSGNEIFTR